MHVFVKVLRKLSEMFLAMINLLQKIPKFYLLYFEQIQLERYGHTAGPWSQPFLSGGHFILNIATLPYKMGMHPMNECQYSLGYYRPGSCAPWLISPVPLSLQGAASQAGAIFGGGALFP